MAEVVTLERFLWGTAPRNKAEKKAKVFPHFVGIVCRICRFDRWRRMGPLTTPILLSRKEMEPRKVIGSIDTSKFLVSASSTLLGLSSRWDGRTSTGHESWI
jgi:hypothetical protein